jgi:GNAT superfamily N-acetyltransferase
MAVMDIDIRSAKRADEVMIANLAGQLGYPSSMHEIRERLVGILEDDDQAVFVAESVDHQVIGWIHFFKTQRLIVEPFVEVGGLIVGEGQRGSGVGQALLAAAEAWAQGSGLTSIRVRSNVIREEAHSFYERLGYTCVKQQNVFYKAIN